MSTGKNRDFFGGARLWHADFKRSLTIAPQAKMPVAPHSGHIPASFLAPEVRGMERKRAASSRPLRAS
jgi:hypothetical protein